MFYKSISILIAVMLNAGINIDVKAEDSIKIGAIFAESGVAAQHNVDHIMGTRIAVRKINTQGGVLGKKLQLLVFDNRSSTVGSKVAADKAVNEKVTAVIGASWSSHSLAMAPVLQKAGIPMISPTSTNPKVTLIGNYIFRVCFIDSFQGKVMAQFAKQDLAAKTAVTMIDLRSDYSMGLAQSFRHRFEQLKGRILEEIPYKQKQQTFTTLLNQVKKLNPDVLFIPGHDESGFIAKNAQEKGIAAILLGGDGWGVKSFLEKGGAELQKAYFSTHWSKEVRTPVSESFTALYGKDATDKFALAHDSVNLLADAIHRAGVSDRAKIREAIASTKNFQGVTGEITFDENGDPLKSSVIMQIANGKVNYLKTVEP